MAKQKLSAESLKGIWAGITLPWKEDYQLDETTFCENLTRLCQAKVHGIYTTGSTGEFYALNFEEFQHMVDILFEVVSPTGIPVQVGCASPNTRDTLQMVEYVADKGCDGVQVVLPFWMKLSDAEVIRFFKNISRAVPSLPLIHYNIPRAKRFLLGPDYRRILEVAPNLIGVKFVFAGSHFGELQRALHLAPELSYFVGENLLVSAMQIGARGSYSSVVCINPSFMLRMFNLAETKQWDEAIAMQEIISRFFSEAEVLLEELGEGGIDPVADKGFAVASGFFAGHQRTRPPYIGWSNAGLGKIRAWLKTHYPELMWSAF
jgi:dihydrodipicolinate synthase/N-acetylneuraminate lyase